MMWFKTLYLIFIFLTFSCGVSLGFDTLKVAAQLDTLRKNVNGSVVYIVPDEPQITSFDFQLYPYLYSSEDSPFLKKMPNLRNQLIQSGKWGEMVIDSVMIDGENVSANLTIELTKGTIDSPNEIPLNGKIVKIYFKTRIPNPGDRLAYIGDEYLLDAWFPTPAILKDDGGWYNPNYGAYSEPVGEYYYFDISLIAPQNYVIAAPVLSKETTVYDTLTNHQFEFGPAHDFALALSPHYLIDSSQIGSTTVRIYFHDYEWAAIDRVRKAINRSFEYMTEHVGEYVYKSFSPAMVNTSFTGGIEFPAVISLMSPRGAMMTSNLYDFLVVHETVHQWFYGMIGSDQTENPWLDEAVTSFFSMKIIEHYWGEEINLFDKFGLTMSERDYYRLNTGLSLPDSKISSPAHSFTISADYFGTVYFKGALAVETFDNLLDDSLSGIFWKEYYKRYLFGHPSTEDFIQLAGEIAGLDKAAVLQELIKGNSNIDYSINRLVNNQKDSVTFKVELTLQREGELTYPVDYRLILYNDDTLNFIWNPLYGTEETTHYLTAPAKIAIIDPENVFVIDGNLLDNSLKAESDGSAGIRVSSGLMFLIESLFSFLGGM